MQDPPGFKACAPCAKMDEPGRSRGLCRPCEENRRTIHSLQQQLRTALDVRLGGPEGTGMILAGDEPGWRDASGNVIAVREMTDSHLVNAIKYLQRRHEAMVFQSMELVNEDGDGDMGLAWEAFCRAGPELSCNQIYPRLLEEALRRKLEVPSVFEKKAAGAG